MTAILSVTNLGKRYGGLRALDGVSFDVVEGEAVAIIGPNGSGKSTLCGVIGGATRPDEGSVHFEGRDVTHVPAHRRAHDHLARTFQIVSPFSEMSARDNVAVGAMLRRRHLADALAKADECLGLVGLLPFSHVLASGLSTGQLKRLELARALASDPSLLMVDEVVGGVDVRAAEEITQVMQRIIEHGVTVVMIEHRLEVVREVASRVLCLHLGEVIADGDPETVLSDEAVRKAYFA